MIGEEFKSCCVDMSVESMKFHAVLIIDEDVLLLRDGNVGLIVEVAITRSQGFCPGIGFSDTDVISLNDSRNWSSMCSFPECQSNEATCPFFPATARCLAVQYKRVDYLEDFGIMRTCHSACIYTDTARHPG